MRDFVEVFRANLSSAGAPADDDTVWRVLRRFQILVFDFESYGSDYEHRARERARLALIPEQASRAIELWPILIEQAGAALGSSIAFSSINVPTYIRSMLDCPKLQAAHSTTSKIK
jgi:hypothetical protein